MLFRSEDKDKKRSASKAFEDNDMKRSASKVFEDNDMSFKKLNDYSDRLSSGGLQTTKETIQFDKDLINLKEFNAIAEKIKETVQAELNKRGLVYGSPLLALEYNKETLSPASVVVTYENEVPNSRCLLLKCRGLQYGDVPIKNFIDRFEILRFIVNDILSSQIGRAHV